MVVSHEEYKGSVRYHQLKYRGNYSTCWGMAVVDWLCIVFWAGATPGMACIAGGMTAAALAIAAWFLACKYCCCSSNSWGVGLWSLEWTDGLPLAAKFSIWFICGCEGIWLAVWIFWLVGADMGCPCILLTATAVGHCMGKPLHTVACGWLLMYTGTLVQAGTGIWNTRVSRTTSRSEDYKIHTDVYALGWRSIHSNYNHTSM